MIGGGLVDRALDPLGQLRDPGALPAQEVVGRGHEHHAHDHGEEHHVVLAAERASQLIAVQADDSILDAVKTFEKASLDVLVLGDIIAVRDGAARGDDAVSSSRGQMV